MPSHPERVRTASLPEGYQFGNAGQPPLLVEKCCKHGRERNSDCLECRSLPRVMFHPGAFEFKVRLVGPGADYRDQHAVAVAESFVKNNPTANRPAVLFRLGVDTCPTCGTTGKYDCPDCGYWNGFTTGRDLGDER